MTTDDQSLRVLWGTWFAHSGAGKVSALHHSIDGPYGSRDSFIDMEEIAERKECGAESGAGKIEIVTNAIFLAPAHGGEPLKSLGNMGEDDEQKTGGPKGAVTASWLFGLCERGWLLRKAA